MIDIETIRKWWSVFVVDGFTEVRILGRFQYSGYFKSIENLIQAIEPYSNMDDEQIYFVLNRIDDACYGRQQSEKIIKSPKITTNDNDIIRRNWVMIDFDPIRKTGVNSNEEEFELAHKKAQYVFQFLRTNGFQEPVICKSGNGWHLQYRVDLPNDDQTTETIKRFFAYLGHVFSDENVDIDQKVFNKARLCKLYGTMAKKGANLPDRPWRLSEIVYVPKTINITPIEKFELLANFAPDEEPKVLPNRNYYGGQRFDLPTWLNEHGIVYREKKSGTSTLYELESCPWIDSHSDRKKWDSALFVDPQGKIRFNCTHSHCKGKTWHDVRLHYEPDAYSKPQYQPQQQYQRYVPQKPKYQIKDELPELGNKWLCMSDIKKVDLSQIESVKTGFVELDQKIVGLHMSEVTMLSGSNASGKSSWLNTLLLNIVQQGKKIALWSGELRSDILKTWIQMVAAGKENLTPSKINEGKYYVPNNIGEQIDQWLDGKFFIYNNEYGTKWEQIFHDMEELLKVGVKVFALDNLFSLDIDLFDGDKNNKQKELILQIKDFAKKNQVHIILVAHPRKVMTFLRKNDISGTSDLTNAVDNVFIIHRVNEDFLHAIREFFGTQNAARYESFGNVIAVEKNRMYGVADLMVGMYYEQESRRFKNSEYENIVYSWKPTYTQVQIVEPQPIQPQQQVVNDNFEFVQKDSAPF